MASRYEKCSFLLLVLFYYTLTQLDFINAEIIRIFIFEKYVLSLNQFYCAGVVQGQCNGQCGGSGVLQGQ